VVNDATDIPTETPKTAEIDTKDQKANTPDNFGEELPLESCVNLVSQIISSQCAQPDFVVNSIGMIPGEEGAPPTFAWLATQVEEGAPFGFGTKVSPYVNYPCFTESETHVWYNKLYTIGKTCTTQQQQLYHRAVTISLQNKSTRK
jgi:hypothetical protein